MIEHKHLISGRQLELLRKAVEIEDVDARAVGMVGYTARLWAQMSLPYRDPGADCKSWQRKNGSMTLIVNPGVIQHQDGEVETAYPFGVMPRLLLTWMATEAVRTQDRTLSLGDSLAEFLRALGMKPTGGKTGSITSLSNQVQRLSSSTMVVLDTRPNMLAGETFTFADSWQLWWTPKEPDTAALWPSTMRLSEKFYDSIVANPIPVDLRALEALRGQGGGGLVIDVYVWLAHRMSYLRKSTLIPWVLLAQQFGSQYTLLRNFRRDLLKQLPKVLTVYPAANVKPTADGLLLSPSPTPVGARRRLTS